MFLFIVDLPAIDKVLRSVDVNTTTPCHPTTFSVHRHNQGRVFHFILQVKFKSGYHTTFVLIPFVSMVKIILHALLFLQRHYYNSFGMGRHFLVQRLKVYFLSKDNWNLKCLVLCSFKFTQVRFFTVTSLIFQGHWVFSRVFTLLISISGVHFFWKKKH